MLCLPAPDADAAVARDGRIVMGTVLEVTVVAADAELALRLLGDVYAEVARWDDALTIWRADGELARLNAHADQGPVTVSPRLQQGLAAMLELSAATGGAFEPAKPTSRGVVAGASARQRLRNVLLLDAGRARLDGGATVDPGGIGKGLALDAALDLLRRGGAQAAFLDFGGSSQSALAAPPGDGDGWTILVAGWAAGSSHGLLKLRDGSVSTSRAAAPDTAPIVDPRTGEVVRGPCLATVLSPSATAADAWSTALVVLGRRGVEEASRRGLEVLVEDSAGVVWTPGFGHSPPAAAAARPPGDRDGNRDRAAGRENADR